MRKNYSANVEVKKLHLEAVVLFALNNIPQADSNTLKQFLELVNAGGSFGTLSHEQILTKMNQVLNYIPKACSNSMLILIDLLEINPPEHFSLAVPRAKLLESGRRLPGVSSFVLETTAAVAVGNDRL